MQRVARAVSAPLEAVEDLELVYEALKPVPAYPYPWPFFRFLDVFPESIHLDPPALQPFAFDPEQRFDLIILAYTVWYLAPAPPITGFLKSAEGRAILNDTPVITITACRNMWHLAQEKVKDLLAQSGARLSDHIALTDQGGSLASFVTTPRWMLSGKKDSLWNLFPAAGVHEQDIQASARFGLAIAQALKQERLDGRHPVLSGLKAATADDRLIPSEKIATRSFMIWGKLVRLFGPPGDPRRVPVLFFYVVFLLTMIVTVVPLTMALRTLIRPLARKRAQALRDRYEQPSGSGAERIKEFSK